ncbi:MAG: molybdopterin biosynthesis protein [Anaerolineaceae bacterium]|nr:molybdopterin biosynthesis protein [Anaerolineaceae bacterium]
MTIYLHDIPLQDALKRFYEALDKYKLRGNQNTETLELNENLVGRVLAKPIWAKISSPHYHASAMDGFAIKSVDIQNAMPTRPISLRIDEQAIYVDTGDPIPDWANCVMPIENTEAINANGEIVSNKRDPYAIRVRNSLTPWSHIRPMGEDIVATELVLPANRILIPVDLGAIAASGQTKVDVIKKPVVSILPTGTELIQVGEEIKRGDIIEYNSIVLAAQIISWGGDAMRYPITKDNFDDLCTQVLFAAERSDLILINAGSSAGSEDFSSKVIEKLGEVYVHGVAVRPGHPVILGMIFSNDRKQVPIIGVPGYPVSAALTGEIFVKPLLQEWTGKNDQEQETIEAELTRKITSPAGDDDYVRVVTAKVGNRILAAPLSRGAGVITSMVRSDGYAIVQRGIQGKEAGDKITVILNKNKRIIDETLLVIGSHDLTLDLLAEYLSIRGKRLVSANVGSLGGLISLNRGEAHFSGSHLFDPIDGTFNTSYVKKYVKNFEVKIIPWVFREQGLIVQKGNLKNITSLEDLQRSDVSFINRQRGAGTRILLDYYLEKLGIDSSLIQGYEEEEFTHLNVAAAIKSHRADTGLGITAAARALDLDFIPLFKERYDLIVPEKIYQSEIFKPILLAMTDEEFRSRVQSLDGYDVSCMGTELIQ